MSLTPRLRPCQHWLKKGLGASLTPQLAPRFFTATAPHKLESAASSSSPADGHGVGKPSRHTELAPAEVIVSNNESEPIVERTSQGTWISRYPCDLRFVPNDTRSVFPYANRTVEETQTDCAIALGKYGLPKFASLVWLRRLLLCLEEGCFAYSKEEAAAKKKPCRWPNPYGIELTPWLNGIGRRSKLYELSNAATAEERTVVDDHYKILRQLRNTVVHRKHLEGEKLKKCLEATLWLRSALGVEKQTTGIDAVLGPLLGALKTGEADAEEGSECMVL